jgi:hypothetical protein
MPLIGLPQEWSSTTKQGVVRDAFGDALTHEHIDGGDCAVCKQVWRSLVDSGALGEAPLVFRTRGEDGKLVDMPRGRARSERLRHFVHEVAKHANEAGATVVVSAEPANVPAPVAVRRDDASQREATEMLRWIQTALRPFCEARNADGKAFDQIGLRPAQNAAKLLTQGVPAPAIKHALTLHYPAEARRQLGVARFDPTTFTPRNWGAVTVPADVAAHDGRHKALPYALAVANAGIPLALVGPPGTGKTTLAQSLAGELDTAFGMVSMTRGTSPSAFNGRPRIGSDGIAPLVHALIARGEVAAALELAQGAAAQGDVAESQFVRIYRDGGVYLFDEMDASEPNLLLLVNAALANGHFANAATGEMVKRSPNFIPVAGMNTLGLGGDRNLVGREKQDAAALDRWHAGRLEILLDAALEAKLFWTAVSA